MDPRASRYPATTHKIYVKQYVATDQRYPITITVPNVTEPDPSPAQSNLKLDRSNHPNHCVRAPATNELYKTVALWCAWILSLRPLSCCPRHRFRTVDTHDDPSVWVATALPEPVTSFTVSTIRLTTLKPLPTYFSPYLNNNARIAMSV